MQPEFKAGMRAPMERASKRATPHDIAGPQPQDPYGPSFGSWDRKDLEVEGQLYRAGARFEALCMGALMAASDLCCRNPNLHIRTMWVFRLVFGAFRQKFDFLKPKILNLEKNSITSKAQKNSTFYKNSFPKV